MKTEVEDYQLKVSKYVHKTFVDIYNIASERTMNEFPDLSDNEKWLVLSRIFNRAFIQFNTNSFVGASKESLKHGDL
jgi:hypothetical protein